MKIAFFGGSFDPPHIGHRAIIDYVSNIFDKVIVLPCKLSMDKTKLIHASSIHRINMLKMMSENKNVYIDNHEIISSEINYTYYTIKYLKNKFHHTELSMILGEDQFNKLDKWYRIDWIIENVNIVCFKRKVDKIRDNGLQIKDIKYIDYDKDISSYYIRQALKENRDVEFFLDRKVSNYIKKEKLYKC